MGLTRVFQKSVRFTFRTKRRFLVFLLIFAIISTVIALNIDNLDTLTTDDLLKQKGVTINKIENVDIPYDKGKTLYDDILNFADTSAELNLEASAMYSYADIDSTLRIHSIDINNPWLSDFISPSFIQSGSFPHSKNEILVPDGSFQKQDLATGPNSEIRSDLAVGQTITMKNGDNEIKLKVAGIFDDQSYRITNKNDSLWLFMDQSMFKQVLNLFGKTTSDALVYSESFVVDGLILKQSTYEDANLLKDHIQTFLEDTNAYGNWESVPNLDLPLKDTKQQSDQILLILGFVVIGGVILSTLFAYLISRFRRREIAILKAMGYSHGAVRASLFAEILTTSFSGFLFGLGIAQGFLLYRSSFDLTALIRMQAIGVSFLIMVIVSLPGMWFASRRILSVSPAEAFRDN